MRDFGKQMEMVLYHSDEGNVSVDAYIKDESIWITQKAMAELLESTCLTYRSTFRIYTMKVNW
jgi:hypothetical protein